MYSKKYYPRNTRRNDNNKTVKIVLFVICGLLALLPIAGVINHALKGTVAQTPVSTATPTPTATRTPSPTATEESLTEMTLDSNDGSGLEITLSGNSCVADGFYGDCREGTIHVLSNQFIVIRMYTPTEIIEVGVEANKDTLITFPIGMTEPMGFAPTRLFTPTPEP